MDAARDVCGGGTDVAASDLWLAVLPAMAAVTDSGYPVVSLEAHPIERARRFE